MKENQNFEPKTQEMKKTEMKNLAPKDSGYTMVDFYDFCADWGSETLYHVVDNESGFAVLCTGNVVFSDNGFSTYGEFAITNVPPKPEDIDVEMVTRAIAAWLDVYCTYSNVTFNWNGLDEQICMIYADIEC